VDAATLTGAIVVALGHVYVGAFSNDDAFAGKVMAAAKAEGEKMWSMPLDDDYKEVLKSTFADLPNIGNRWGGAITAAMFLKEFVDTTPWVHLDIAGTAWLEEAKPFLPRAPRACRCGLSSAWLSTGALSSLVVCPPRSSAAGRSNSGERSPQQPNKPDPPLRRVSRGVTGDDQVWAIPQRVA